MVSQKPKRESRRKAAESGRKMFLARAGCPRCRGLLRYTSNGQCVKCARERSRDNHREIRQLLNGQASGEDA